MGCSERGAQNCLEGIKRVAMVTTQRDASRLPPPDAPVSPLDEALRLLASRVLGAATHVQLTRWTATNEGASTDVATSIQGVRDGRLFGLVFMGAGPSKAR